MFILMFLRIATVLMIIISVIMFYIKLRPIISAMKKGRPQMRWDRLGERLSSVFTFVIGHKRLLRLRLAGVIHLFIFSGFVVFFLDIVETIGRVINPSFSFGSILGVIVNLWVIIVLTGVALAIYHRLVIKPKRFIGSNHHDAMFVLGLIAILTTGIVVHNSFFMLLAEPVYGLSGGSHGHFLAYMLSKLWVAIGWDTPTIASIGYAIGYFMDIGGVLLFLVHLPGSKHFHVFTAVPAVFFRNLDQPSDVTKGEENEEKLQEKGLAINTFEDFTWKDTLDLVTCTECGRCQDVCPAHLSGSPLSPKLLITDLRDALLKNSRNSKGEIELPIAGNIISEETLWACTTCRACEEACPVFIEHVPKIVGLRAALVENGAVEERAKTTFNHWYDQNNAYAENPVERPTVQKKVDLQFKDARKEEVDWLWFLGDVASFDSEPAVIQSINSISMLLKKADLNVGLLFDGEANSGNDVLRMGEFGLFEKLAKENMDSMELASFQRLFTSDPHSFNALANDYPKLGFNKPVFHYTQLLLELLKDGRLEVQNPFDARVTFHDACYLGRWNGIFDQPREILQLCGAELVEMPRNRECSLCCGAGGGKFWMNESGVKERPSEARIKEAVELENVSYFVVSCPKDLVMYSAAVASLGYEDRIKVIDIADVVAMAVGSSKLQVRVS